MVTSSIMIGPLDMNVGFNSVKTVPGSGSDTSDGERLVRSAPVQISLII